MFRWKKCGIIPLEHKLEFSESETRRPQEKTIDSDKTEGSLFHFPWGETGLDTKQKTEKSTTSALSMSNIIPLEHDWIWCKYTSHTAIAIISYTNRVL